jgi:hypothetical protein
VRKKGRGTREERRKRRGKKEKVWKNFAVKNKR